MKIKQVNVADEALATSKIDIPISKKIFIKNLKKLKSMRLILVC